MVVPWGVNRRGPVGTGALHTAAVNAAAREIVRWRVLLDDVE